MNTTIAVCERFPAQVIAGHPHIRKHQSVKLLMADPQFHKLARALRSDRYLGKFSPVSLLVDAQNGTGPYLSDRKPPPYTVRILNQGYISFHEAAIVESAHPIFPECVIEGNEAKRLEGGFAISLISSNTLDHQDQSIELV